MKYKARKKSIIFSRIHIFREKKENTKCSEQKLNILSQCSLVRRKLNKISQLKYARDRRQVVKCRT
jgi:hypothetical protein